MRSGHVIRSVSSGQPARRAWSTSGSTAVQRTTPSIWCASSSVGMCAKRTLVYSVAPPRPGGGGEERADVGQARPHGRLHRRKVVERLVRGGVVVHPAAGGRERDD